MKDYSYSMYCSKGLCIYIESKIGKHTENILPLAEAYNFFDKTLLGMKCTLTSCTLADEELETIDDVFLEITPLKSAFPNLLQLALTIVVSTAECEQSFSALKCTKSYLRSIMSEGC